MMRYDLHLHTNISRCASMRMTPETILKIAKRKGLDGIAPLDHNTIKGSLRVAKSNKDKDFEVITANEVKTQYGDVIIYYINEDPPSNDLFELLDFAKEIDAVVSIAHPFRFMPHLHFNYPIRKIANKIHAVECLNSRTLPFENKKAVRIADELNLAKTAGSDAHFPFEIGRGYAVFYDDFRTAVKKRKISVGGNSLAYLPGNFLTFIKRRLQIQI
ncbi:PHP domain-containing protein [Candidatus Woesearchaeota archaeon]|nr:MAG: PHP domain-containing protein [Candidatus Woesearchaeota archaeon]